jgi:hypothetical protein
MTTYIQTVKEINRRIKKEICYNTLLELTDENLMSSYKECNSVKNEIKKLGTILDTYLDEEMKQKIIKDSLIQLINTCRNKRSYSRK